MMRARNERERMLCNISIISFTIVDLTLYLDTHSDDKRAQEYFNHYIRLLNKLKEEFAMKYGPLNLATAGGNCDDNWRWATMPMPWEGVC